MAVNPEELARQDPERPPQLEVILGGQGLEGQVEVIPDVSAMTIEEFRVYIHKLAQAGEQEVQAVLDSLLEVDDSLTAHQHEVSHSMVELTVLVSELSQELNLTFEKKRWARGYIRDRQQ